MGGARDVQAHHAILQDEAGGGELEQLSANSRGRCVAANGVEWRRVEWGWGHLFFESACAPLTTAVTDVESVMGSARVSPSGSGTYLLAPLNSYRGAVYIYMGWRHVQPQGVGEGYAEQR
jgi:hypothetical protein